MFVFDFVECVFVECVVVIEVAVAVIVIVIVVVATVVEIEVQTKGCKRLPYHSSNAQGLYSIASRPGLHSNPDPGPNNPTQSPNPARSELELEKVRGDG